MKAEHQKFHECLLGPTGEHTCKKFSKRATALNDRLDVLNKLRWQAMQEEYPASFDAKASVGLREGWTLVGCASRRSRMPAEPSSNSIKLGSDAISRNLIPRISKIILEPPASSPGIKIQPVGEHEKVVSEITDSRIQALFNLSLEVRDAARKTLPAEIPWTKGDNSESVDSGKIQQWLDSRPQNEARAILNIITETNAACAIVSDLAWRAVRDGLDDKTAPSIALRDEWKIVSNMPESEEEEYLEKLFGDATVIPGGSSLLEALLRH